MASRTYETAEDLACLNREIASLVAALDRALDDADHMDEIIDEETIDWDGPVGYAIEAANKAIVELGEELKRLQDIRRKLQAKLEGDPA